jgi:hypothetical protein
MPIYRVVDIGAGEKVPKDPDDWAFLDTYQEIDSESLVSRLVNDTIENAGDDKFFDDHDGIWAVREEAEGEEWVVHLYNEDHPPIRVHRDVRPLLDSEMYSEMYSEVDDG